MASEYWAACQTMPGREHVIRSEIEKGDRGAFLPTYAKTWISDGKISARECPMVPGYVFFKTTVDGWGCVAAIEGVHQVLANGLAARRVSDVDMARLVLNHATGAGNILGAFTSIRSSERRKNSRKPRPGKRIRMRKNTS